MPNLSDFIDPDLTTSDVIHSNGYAQAASGSVSGGAGSDGLSIEQRRKLMYGRRIVGSYTQSQLGQRYGAIKARAVGEKTGRAYDANTGKFSEKAGYSIRRSTGLRRGEQAVAPPVPQRHFVEPPTRAHDPFA